MGTWAIIDCHSYDDDPECLRVIIEPSALPDVSTLSIVEEKLTNVQQELDSCWAVLGEVYGRIPPLNKLTMKIRRVQSDIREPFKINQLPYVPFKASLESTRADLLKLLIEPLYGNNPGIGVRELVQNAVDAVREFNFIIKEMPDTTTIDRENLDSDVVVSFEKDDEDNYWVRIADRGIGMTWQTVCKYYLTAGASFRQSGAWKKIFTSESGESQILRSGRFGIGVLAAFLLGGRVRVSTRHIDEPADKGIEFEFGLDDTIIELRWKKKAVGTTVAVRTTSNIIEKLKTSESYREQDLWDWYFLKNPKLLVKDLGGEILESKYKMPGCDDSLPIDWHCIKAPGLQAVNWTYRNVPNLTCNGMLIGRGSISIERCFDYKYGERDIKRINSYYWYQARTHICLDAPNVSVFDPNGYFPLNLARSEITREPVELEELLADDVSRNFIAFCLCKGPNNHLLTDTESSSFERIKYPGKQNYHYGNNPNLFFDTPDGFGLSDPYYVSQHNSLPGLIIRLRNLSLKISKSTRNIVMKNYDYIMGMQTGDTLGEFDNWYKSLTISEYAGTPLPIFRGITVNGFRLLMSRTWYDRFTYKQPQYILSHHKIEFEDSNIVVFTIGNCLGDGEKLLSLANDLVDNKIEIDSLTESYISSTTVQPEPCRIAQIWQEAIGGPIIPFDKEKRQKIIDKLDDKFKRHIEQWSSKVEIKRRRR